MLVLILLFHHFGLSLGVPIVDHIFDLTHEFANGYTIAWPSATQYNFTIRYRSYNEEKGFWYESNDFSQAEHCGTHTDAPSHFSKNGWRLGEIPLERLILPGIVIDISSKAKENPDAQLEIDDIIDWEQKHGRIPNGAILIMNSGTGKYYNNKTRYFGWPNGMEQINPQDTENLHFPGIDPQAAEWLVENRVIYATGVDTASVDFGQSKDFQSHQIFSQKNIWGLENLKNVNMLPAKGFMIYNMVYKGRDGSGGPSRVIAVLKDDSSTNTNASDVKGKLSKIAILFCLVLHFY